jgi:hypothetical protein
MSSKKKLVVLQDNGYLTQIEPNQKKITDKVLFEGTSEECENVIHGRKRK